jgi:hypothetical protein
MAKFNKTVTQPVTLTTNLAGGEAYQETPELALASLLLTSLVQDQYYRTAGEQIQELKRLAAAISDKEFVMKAAVYARNEFGNRSITHALAAELAGCFAEQKKSPVMMKRFIDRVIRRVDDATEIASYYLTNVSKNKKLPWSLKRGLGQALGHFDAYSLGKYKGEKHALKLVDLVNLVHPPLAEKNGRITVTREAYLAAGGKESDIGLGDEVSIPTMQALVLGLLKSTETWEAKLTEAGKRAAETAAETEGTEEEKEAAKQEKLAEGKKEAWTELLAERKLGAFGALRNCRNILAQAPEAVDALCDYLKDEKLIRKSLVFPFRYITAIREIEKTNFDGTQKVLSALSEAVDILVSNLPKFGGKTLVALDGSGSMVTPMKARGETIASIGALFAAILHKRCDADLIIFANEGKYKRLNTSDSTLTLAERILKSCPSGGTNFHAIFETANKAYDRVIILSDMQGWLAPRLGMTAGIPRESFAAYREKYQCDPHVFSWDLAGLSSLQFPESKVYALAGFSEKCLDLVKILESDRHAMINAIKAVQI